MKMQSKEELKNTFKNINGRGYKAYKQIQSNWYDFGYYKLGIPYVQGDPFASPSSILIRIDQQVTKFPAWFWENKIRRMAVADFLTRLIEQAIKKYSKGQRGSGKSGLIAIAKTGQEVLERTSVEFNKDMIEARLSLGLPAAGRRVLGNEAFKMFFEELPKIINSTLYYDNINSSSLEKHVQVVEDQETLRGKLEEQGLVAFIANGSILPRQSGIDDRPLTGNKVVHFMSPPEYEVTFDLPHLGKIKGMGVKEGITLIVGGGYHGKSTLLNALEKGVYNHIPGDGREYVVTREDAVKIRAEDGRRIEKVDISPFINNLPQGETTTDFCTENASGSTSQAANIIEALEIGTKLLLIDEDTCATNFMIRDSRMQRLVTKDKEPITPFIDKVKSLYTDYKVSTVIVVGGAGDYFDVADHVIMMDEYRPKDVTNLAHKIAIELPTQRKEESSDKFGRICRRVPDPDSINPKRGNKLKVKASSKDVIHFGRNNIELSNLEQLLNREQAKTIGYILVFALQKGIIDGQSSLGDILNKIFNILEKEGLKIISPFNYPDGDYVKPRPYEVGAALNRLRTLKVKRVEI
jgi:predicted ABC-class ATPase